MDAARDEIVRTLSSDGGISVRALVATELVGEAVRRHRASPTAATALGRALMGAVLLASGKKEGETVQLQFRGNGPLGPLTAIADSGGRVRGFASRPDVDGALGGGPTDVGSAVGTGVLAVVRYHPSWREPYTGIVALESFREGTPVIARDLGPLPEVVRSSGGGLLFGTQDELRSALRKLAGNPALREQKGAAGREALLGRWVESVVIEQYLDLIAGVACRRGVARVEKVLGSRPHAAGAEAS